MDSYCFTLALLAFFGLLAALIFAVAFFRERLRAQRAQFFAQPESVRMFIDITQRWGELYQTRNAILVSPIDGATLYSEYGEDYARFLNSDEWKKIRELCNFFELLGLFIHERHINPESLFVIITVDDPNERLSKKLIPIIEYLRSVYRKDIYVFYDKYLLPLYKKYQERNDGVAGKLPRKIPSK